MTDNPCSSNQEPGTASTTLRSKGAIRGPSLRQGASGNDKPPCAQRTGHKTLEMGLITGESDKFEDFREEPGQLSRRL